jgi:hypothetical protein
MIRTVTERDLRMPEFRDAKPEELEFRDDGALVRKDRWESGVRRIANAFGMRDWEVPDVVARTRQAADLLDGILQATADDIWAHMQEGTL